MAKQRPAAPAGSQRGRTKKGRESARLLTVALAMAWGASGCQGDSGKPETQEDVQALEAQVLELTAKLQEANQRTALWEAAAKKCKENTELLIEACGMEYKED